MGILPAKGGPVALLMLIRRLFSAVYLIKHRAVPLRLKLLPALAVLYVLSPRDLVPDFIRGFGLIDDIIVTSTLFGIFTTRAMKYVLTNERRRKNSIDADFEVLGRVDADLDPDTRPEDDCSPEDDLRSV